MKVKEIQLILERSNPEAEVFIITNQFNGSGEINTVSKIKEVNNEEMNVVYFVPLKPLRD